MMVHPLIQNELARQHQSELLREAEQHRLATLAAGERPSGLRRLGRVLLRRRPVAEPKPSERAVSVPSGS